MEEQLLEKIAENTNSKSSRNIVVSGRNNPIITTFKAPILLDKKKKYEIALTNLDTYYSFPNIDLTNNSFKYQNSKGKWKNITIETGSYEIAGIRKEIHNQVDDKKDIDIKPNRATLKCMLIVRNGCTVDFNVENSLATVLGFNKQKYKAGSHNGEHLVNIMQVNTIMVNLDIVTNSYIKGVLAPVIYNFFPDVSPGVKIIQSPTNFVYLPITVDTINCMRVWLTDQDHHPLNFRGEQLTIRFHLRDC